MHILQIFLISLICHFIIYRKITYSDSWKFIKEFFTILRKSFNFCK